MSLKALAIAFVAFALTTANVVAQGDPRKCGDFDFSEQNTQRIAAAEILKDLRSCDVRVINAIVDGDLIWQSATIEHGLIIGNSRILGTVDFSLKTGVDFSKSFEGSVDFSGTTFEGSADFYGARFGGDAFFRFATFGDSAGFSTTTFQGAAAFTGTTFGSSADFSGTTFEGVAFFNGTSFAGTADFRVTLFSSRLFFNPKIYNVIWPPNSGIIVTDLPWNQVKETFPSGEHPIDMHGRWENFFTISNKAADAAQVRTSRRRFQLRVWVWTVAGSLGIGWVLFTPLYYWRFRNDRRSSTLRHIGKLLLFSLDVISPSIRPWKYDWDEDGGLPVRRVAVITAVESATGWILLGLGSAIAVAWLTA